MDLNMTWDFYQKNLDAFPQQDHYFILDMNYNVIYDSKSPVMLKIASIT